MCSQSLVKAHLTASGNSSIQITRCCHVILQVRDQFQYTLLCLSRALLTFVPVRDRSSQINSLDLLNKGSDDLKVFVANGSHPNEIQVDSSQHVSPNYSLVLLSVGVIAQPRDDELILTRFTPVNVVVSVEEGAIVDHERHLVALMHNLEIAIKVNWSNLDFLVVLRQDIPLVLEVLDELLRSDVLDLDFANVERRSRPLPQLMLNHIVLLIIQHYRNLSLPLQQAHGLIKQPLLHEHSSFIRLSFQLDVVAGGLLVGRRCGGARCGAPTSAAHR